MSLVELKGNDLLASSKIIALGVQLEHRSILALIDKYKSRFEKHGVIAFEMRKSAGRPVRVAWLNEIQATFLISLMKNSEIVVEFKEKLVDEYFRLKDALQRALLNNQNEEWLAQRKIGKVARLNETSAIKKFVDYCKVGGSKNAETYYVNLTGMENKSLFFIEQKFKNVRDMMAGHQLQTIANADKIVARQLEKCMEQELDYHEGYKMAKKAIETFVELIGKTPIPENIKLELKP